MKIGKVIGSVVATTIDESLEGVTLLLVQPLADDLTAKGDPLVACDCVQAGPGDRVLYEGGREAAVALTNWYNPSDATVMAIIDSLDGES
ncbi:MAG: ethanolamine utilization protein EutN [Spirochaetaceae bacterium]|jgi:ethanolamine utilization protein EutN|nr:MAG: ethanolamine utilization protein EutN [Spirochaetaceae bacterium]